MQAEFADWVEQALGVPIAVILAEAQAAARRRLSKLPVDRCAADTCPGCGNRMVRDPALRVVLLECGGVAWCDGCGIEKKVVGVEVPPDPGVKLVSFDWVVVPKKKAEARLGRFSVLPRTDGLWVVYEKQPPGEPRRFGPVFATEDEAKWRIWWRVEGEKKTGRRLGEVCLIQGALAVLTEFLDERRAVVVFRETGEVVLVSVASLIKRKG